MRKIFFVILSAVLLAAGSCWALSDLPDPGTPNYSKNTRTVFGEWQSAIEGLQRGEVSANPDSTFNVTVYGAVPDDGVDDSAAFQDAIDAAELVSGTVYAPVGQWDLASTINIPYNVSFEGVGLATKLSTMSGGNYTDGYLVRCNRIAADSSWDQPYPGDEGFFRYVTLTNEDNQADINHAMYIADKRDVNNVAIAYFYKGIQYTLQYLDDKTLHRVHFINMISDTYYPINTGWLGDGLYFSQISTYFEPSTPPENRKSIYMKGAQGGSVTESILNGEVYVTDTTNVGFINNHLELYYGQNGYVFNNVSNIAVINNYIQLGNNSTVPGIRIYRTGGSVNLSNIVLDHVNFVRPSRNFQEFNTGPEIFTSDALLTIRDCSTSYYFGATNETEVEGIYIANNDTGLPIEAFNKRSPWLSKYAQIRDTELVPYSPIVIEGGNGTAGGSIAPITLSSKFHFSGTTGTYYYRVQAIYDTDRQLGVTTEEENIAVTNGGDAPTLPVVLGGGYSRISNLVVYRGPAADTYTEKAVIPSIYTYLLHDGGTNINGIPWVARTGGPVDTLNTDMQDRIIATKDNVTVYTTIVTQPVVGTWEAGDIITPINVTSGAEEALVCTTTGTPGTWEPMVGIPSTGYISYNGAGILTVRDEYRVTNTIPAIKLHDTDGFVDTSLYLNSGSFMVGSLVPPYGALSTVPLKIDVSAPTDSFVIDPSGNVNIGNGLLSVAGDILANTGSLTIGDTTRTTNGTIKWDGSDFWCRDNGVWVLCGTPQKNTADPCSALPEGTLFYNDTSDYMCFCDSTTVGKQLQAPATNCF